MNILVINKNYIIKIIIYLTWISLILSINTHPHEILFFGLDIIKTINALRIFIPLTIIFILTIFITYLILKKKIILTKYDYLFYFWFFYFFLQIISGVINEGGVTDEKNIYYTDWSYQKHIHLPILGIGTIFFLYIVKHQKFELKYFLNILIGFITLISLMLLSTFLIKKGIKTLNFYGLIDIDVNAKFINQPTPRITGLSRMLAITNLFCLSLFLFRSLNKYQKIFLFLAISTLSIVIIASQSRGTLICFYLAAAFAIFLLTNNFLLKKIYLFIILILIPIFTYVILNTTIIDKQNTIIDKQNTIIDKQNTTEDYLNTVLNTRYFLKTDSGRFYLWKKVLNRYDYTNLLGYGAQTDRRFLLENVGNDQGFFGNNVSNGFIYAFICGGYLALLCYLIINYKIANNIAKIISKIKNFNNDHNIFYYKLSSIYLLFFFIRQIFENSFSLFSTDFLIVIICIFIIDKNNHNFKKKLNIS